MITDLESLKLLDLDQFSADLEELKQEIHNTSEEESSGEDAVILEVVNVIQEEIAQRKKSSNTDLRSDVKFLAYINLFNSLFEDDFDDFEDFDEDFLDDLEEDEK